MPRAFELSWYSSGDDTITQSPTRPMVPDQATRSAESPGLPWAPARRKCRLESPVGLSEYDAGRWQCVLPCFFDSHRIDGTFEVTGVTMLGSCEVIAFVATAQPAKAKEFYENILGLRLVADEPFALVFDANGTMLRIAKVQMVTPARHTVFGWKVPDVRQAITDLRAKGITFEQYEGLPQDDMGICSFPGGSEVAWFRDPDGNKLSLTQFDSSASTMGEYPGSEEP
jgi:catechol 2,3-dioxygenase-like lactoylglutathione lyase family enzyme